MRFELSNLRLTWLVVVALALTACEQSTSRSYGVRLFDASGNEVASGALTLANDPGEAGSYYIEPASDLSEAAPEIRAALTAFEDKPMPLEMDAADDQVRINLHPGWADNNVLLIGTWKNGTLEGWWEHATIAGASRLGTFKAVPVPQGSDGS